MQHIVKRRGRTETFDERKTYASVYSACRSVGMTEAESELLADSVTSELKTSIKKAKLISSTHLFKLTLHILRAKNPDAAYMYEHHRDIS